jgi:hypothetical protein
VSLFDLASSLKRILPPRSTRDQRRSSPQRASLRLEHLEDRFVPAVTDLTTGVPYATIQQAVNAANSGDTILADAGTYTEQVTINKSLTLEGAQHGVDARDGRPGAPESTLLLGFGGLQLNADGITIDGFMVKNADPSNTNGLIAGGATSNHFVLKNTILMDDNAATGAPILFQGGSHTNMQFTQDLFQDRGDSTFYIGSNAAGDVYDGLTISNSKFLGQAGGVFYAAGSNGNPLRNATIQGNEFDGTVNGTPGVGDPLLNIGQSVNLTIADNYFHDLNYTSFQVGMVGGSILRNTFERIHADSSAGFGDVFQLWGGQWGTAVSTNVTIANNIIHYNDVAGATLPTRGIRLRPHDSSSSSPGIDGTTIHINDNAFLNGGVLANDLAIVNQGDPTKLVEASANWWSTTSAVAIQELMSGPVDFTPYFNSATNTLTVGDGFHGDYSRLSAGQLTPPGGTGGVPSGDVLLAKEQSTFTVPGTSNQLVLVQFRLLARHTSFRDEVGVFLVDDAQGRIAGLLPNNPHYLRRAMQLGRWRVIFSKGQKVGSTLDMRMNGGERLMFYLVPNGGLGAVLRHNPRNQLSGTPVVLFADGGRNPDRVNHLRTSPLPSGVVLRWEDGVRGAGRDFNDVVFGVQPIRRPV